MMLRATFRAEWTKLWTLPGTIWQVLSIAVLTGLVNVGVAATVHCPCEQDVPKTVLTGVLLGQAAAAIVAVVFVSNEYSTGLVQLTLTAMPRRWLVLVAKAAIVTGLVLAAAAAGVAGSMIAARLMIPSLSLDDGAVLRAAGGSVLYLGLVALLALGAATMIRDTAVAIGTALGLLYLFPMLAALATDPHWQRRLEQIGPMPAGLAIQATQQLKSLPIGPWPGLGVLAAWAFGSLMLGLLLFEWRDA
jgi:ABC-2 type transport system permease protein